MTHNDPLMPCDLVMKGGITSGVLYPPAIREIANKYYLVGIGGTSAGAIAASLAAAAEYRRRQTDSDQGFTDLQGFVDLEALSGVLAEPGKLLSLFRPDKGTRKLFALGLSFLEGKAGFLAKLKVGRLLLSREKTFRKVVDNGFGLCSGMANDNRSGADLPLTEWLADEIDRIAGKTDGTPLTFADLHGAKIPPILERLRDGQPGATRSIDFRAMTTCVTFGRPLEMPFRERIFAFRESEWRRLFPDRIVKHLVAEAGKIDSPTLAQDGCLPLPVQSLPIVVAARMSLSFPVLFSMVPLYAVNYHKKAKSLERVWLSDGGVTSNFPLHRFDSLYPTWPTLGINLQYTDDSGVPQRRRLARDGTWVYLPEARSRGTLDLWNVFDNRPSETAKILGFAGSIFRSAQVWHDNAFLKLPGYRDRLAEIWLTSKEGGLNLDMDQPTIDTLVGRGREAGDLIASRFAETDPGEAMSWNAHRWARLRSGMAGLFDSLIALASSARAAVPGSPPLSNLLAKLDAPPTYKFKSAAERARAESALQDLLTYLDGLPKVDDAPTNPFAPSAPRPHVEVGTRASI